MLQYKDFSNLQTLIEKQITIGNGKKYGQVVFIVGGSGSGKSFAVSNFLDSFKFKIYDPDKLKEYYIKTKDIFNSYPELKDFSFKNPEQVNFLHQIMKKKEIGTRSIEILAKSQKNSEHKTNLIIDITLKDIEDLLYYADFLSFAGYKPEDIHIVWVLNDYNIAVKQNQERNRTLPNEVVFNTHVGASSSVWQIINNKIPDNINGGIYVVLAHKDHVIFFNDKKTVIKDFKYLTIKKPNEVITTEQNVLDQLWDWIVSYVPSDFKNKQIFGSSRFNRKLYSQ